jgi:hypothetical protein
MSVEGGSRGVVRFWRFRNERYRLEGNRDPSTGECFFPARIAPFSNNGHKKEGLADIGGRALTLESAEKRNNGRGNGQGEKGEGEGEVIEVVVFSSSNSRG